MKRINVLLVQPKTPSTFWSLDSAVKAAGCKAIMPPLGLMTIAAMLPDNYQVKLADLNVKELDRSEVEQSDMVFLTGMWIHRESFVTVVRLCNELGKTIVAGGPLVTSAHGVRSGAEYDYIESGKINHLILYEAESNLPAFLRDFEQGKAVKVYENREKPSLALTPVPRFDLIHPGDYGSMSLQFSRGCPFNCEFCDIIQMFGRVPRTKSPGQFIREMESLYGMGYRGRLFVVDDNFIGNKTAVKQLLREVITWQQERDYPYLLFTEASIDLARDDELLALMVKAGFTSVFLGIESPDPETLTAMNKTPNIRCDMDASIEKIQRLGLEVMGGFILGFDSDPPDIFRRQLEFIQRNGIVQSMVGLLGALPNTDLYKRLEREGRLIELREQSTGDNVDAQLNFIPKMPASTLVDGYKHVIMETYAPKKYFSRALTLISRLPDLKVRDLRHADPWRKALARAKLAHPPKTIKILWSVLGLLFSSYGYYVFPFLIKSLRYGVLSLHVAFDLAFRGRHYYTVSRKINKVEVPP